MKDEYKSTETVKGMGEEESPVSASKHPEEPGVFPFTRGIHPKMYQERHWTIRQYAGLGLRKIPIDDIVISWIKVPVGFQ